MLALVHLGGRAALGEQAQEKRFKMRESDTPREVEYLSQDGARASMGVFHADDPAAPVVIVLPAMGVRAKYYKPFALALRRTGLHAVFSDLRGIGTSSVRASRGCDFGYAEILGLDLPALTAKVEECFPHNRRLLLGHSLGGQLWTLFLSSQPGAGEGLITIAACNVHYRGWSWPMRWRVLGMALALRSLGAVLGYVPADKLGFAGTEARTVVLDWSNNCLTGRYDIAHSKQDYEQSLTQMSKPVLAISFELDRLAPRKSIENLLSKLRSAQVTRRHFVADYPGLEKASHFNWVKRPEVVAQTVRTWLDERGLGSAERATRQP
jgi:predicted alpha/beta hydrolase